MSETKDKVMPDGAWEFDDEVTQVFEDMLRRSIPQYDVMRRACHDLAMQHAVSNTDILDLGCSRGEAMARMVRERGAYNRFMGVDVSEPMLDACRERFKGMIDNGTVEIRNLDLREDFPPVSASVILCILTLQFTPIEYRQRIVKNIHDHLIEGGVLILVEKVLGDTADIDQLMVDVYYQLKSEHGYTQDQIERKRLSLEGVLVPVTARWNEELLRSAGFAQVDCFWRWMNFAGWLAVR